MDWAPFGKLGKTHGLKGELKLHPFFQDPDLCTVGFTVWLDGEEEGISLSSEFSVESIRGSSPIIKFKGCDSLEDAKA
ncbi:MAG: 16S rRNA processing protein RimM, partial [Nitrospinota bacterium]|nr:16S rRNA processing protein RimM [Nitrospinota bacterium]